MSEPATIAPVSVSASGYEDGLGRRTLEFDRESGVMLERLHLRPELWAFEAFLRERIAIASALDSENFARVRAVERDSRNILTVVSQFVPGHRLCELLEAATNLPADEASCPSVDAALGFLLEILPALGALHDSSGVAHGTLGPGRIALTGDGRVIVLDAVFGPAVERLQLNRRRLWREFDVAAPAGTGPAALNVAGDIAQACLAAMMIVLGRPLRSNEYPDGMSMLLTEVIEIAQIRGSAAFASGLEAFLARTLPLSTQRPHGSAVEAAGEVRLVAREIGVARCRAALTAFVGDMNRVLADARERAEVASDPIEDAVDAAIAADAIEFDISAAPLLPEDLPVEISPETQDLTADRSSPAFDSFDASTTVDAYEPLAAPFSSGYDPPPLPDGPADVFVERASSHEPAVAPVVEALTASEPEPPSYNAIPSPEPDRVDARSHEEPIPEPEPEVEAYTEPKTEPELPVLFVPAPAPPAAVAEEPAAPPPPVAAPVPIVPDEPVVAKRPEPPPPPSSKRKRRGGKPHRDKLRSNAAPKPTPPAPRPTPPVAPAVPLPVPLGAAPPMPGLGRISDPLRQEPSAPIRIAAAPALRPPAPPKPPAPLRVKSDGPSGYAPASPRTEWREPPDVNAIPYVQRRDSGSSGGFNWRVAAGAVVLLIIGVGAGSAYLPGRGNRAAEKAATPPPAAATKAVESSKVGTLALTTQPAGARVLIDGKPMGETPVTLTDLAPGKHALTLVTASGSVKKLVRVEAGKTTTLEVPIYSGWIAVFAPIPLDIAENGRAIGTTDQGRLMLSPGLHQLTLSNKRLSYKAVQVVDIEPGEERSISVQPTGELNVNAAPWAEVWMAGKKVGETPIAGLQVPLGTHDIVLKNPQFPERHVTVTVTGVPGATASTDFTK